MRDKIVVLEELNKTKKPEEKKKTDGKEPEQILKVKKIKRKIANFAFEEQTRTRDSYGGAGGGRNHHFDDLEVWV